MLTVRLDSSVPIGEQITAGLRAMIASGAVGPGDELPPVRQLAGDLGVNLNTVARAYKALEAGGLVVSARGRGTRVVSGVERGVGEGAVARESVRVRLRGAMADAKLAGLSKDAAGRILDELFDEFWRAEGAV